MNDLPTFHASTMATSNTSAANLTGGGTFSIIPATTTVGGFGASNLGGGGNFANLGGQSFMSAPVAIKAKLRIVRVFLVDPDERLPVAKRFLYRDDAERVTDENDMEIFHSIPVKELLDKHNSQRKAVKWEEKSGEGTKQRTGLKEIRIRDLIMSVTTIAEFSR